MNETLFVALGLLAIGGLVCQSIASLHFYRRMLNFMAKREERFSLAGGWKWFRTFFGRYRRGEISSPKTAKWARVYFWSLYATLIGLFGIFVAPLIWFTLKALWLAAT